MDPTVRATPFPAVLYDGKKEISLGSYAVWPPSFNVKKFRSVIAETIGVAETQVFIYLADRRGSRIPLTHRLNIRAACLDQPGAWFFLIVLKRRRPVKGVRPQPAPERDEAPKIGAWNWQMEAARRSYLARLTPGVGPWSVAGDGRANRSCEECSKGTGEFHCCVNDAFVFRFRSWAGPVARPEKPKVLVERPVFPYPEYRLFPQYRI